MKRLIAIIFLIAHLFPVSGQLLLRQFAVYRAHQCSEKQASLFLYDENDLVEIKIPVDMPVISDWTSYQPIAGRVDFANASYNYAKLKMTRHAIYLMCAPYYESGHLNNGNILEAKGIPDMPVPKKDHVPEIKFPAHVQYEPIKVAFNFTAPVKYIQQKPVMPVHLYGSGYTDIPEQPPKTC